MSINKLDIPSQLIISKLNALIVVVCFVLLTSLFISEPAYSLGEEPLYKETLIFSPKENTEIKGLHLKDSSLDSASYYSINREFQFIKSNDYIAFYTGGHSNSEINLADLKNPIMLLQYIFVLVVSLLILIYSFLFQLLFALAAIVCSILFLVNCNKVKENSK